MKVLSDQVAGYLERSSWIRRMFETGTRLKKEHGPDNVFDFSLGNPDLPPPAEVGRALAELAREADCPFAMGYMANAGYPDVRERLAEHLSKEQELSLGPDDLVLTCGAAGGLNVIFRAVLEPGDEVLCPAPYFVEYGFYAQNHGGVLCLTPPNPPGFGLDLKAIEERLSPRTRVVLINSPNNPTGQVYGRAELEPLADLLSTWSRRNNRPVFLVSDEPYRFLVYDGVQVPPILPLYEHSLVVSSFSKSLSLAGERVGYIACHPSMPGKQQLMGGLILANRILGFVNAPALGQRIVGKAMHAQVDVSVYARRREAMAAVLGEAGYEFALPRGGFYFFPQAPGGDDVEFVRVLQEQLVLAVPGSGFGCPGHFRMAFCVGEEVIRGARQGLLAARSIFPARA
jgi:aspartate aminotransferase